MAKFTHAIARGSIAFRWPLLLLAVILATLAYYQSRGLDFDRRIETMFAPDDPLLPPYQELKDTFGGNEIVGLVYRDEELLNEDGSGIERLREISQRLQNVPGVRDVLSLSAVNRVLDKIRAMDPLRTYDKLCVVDPNSTLGRNYRGLFVKYTHGTDNKTVAAVSMLYPERDSNARAATIEQLRAIASSLPLPGNVNNQTVLHAVSVETLNLFGCPLPMNLATTAQLLNGNHLGFQNVALPLDGLIVGEPAMVVDGFRYVEEDGWRLGWATSILLAVTIILCFRNLRWVVIPLVVVQFAVLMTKAVLVVSSFQLSMVSSMLTSIVTVTGIATVIHITIRFREFRERGLPPREALGDTITLLCVPVFWTCLTTAAGFGSLLVAKVGPVQDFGLMLAIGSLFVLFSVVLVVPGLVLMGSFGLDPKTAWGEKILDRQLHRIVSRVEKSPLLVGGLILLVVALTVSGMSRLDVESDFTRNFRADTPIVTSYEYVEENLGGAGVWDIILPTPKTKDNSSLTDDYLDRMRRLETRLRDFPHIPVTDESELPKGWQRYDRASSRFSAAFPVEPKYVSWRDKRGLVTSQYQSTPTKTSLIYSVVYKQLVPADVAADPDAIIEKVVERFAKLTKERNESTIDGRSAVELVFEYDNKGAKWISKSWYLLNGPALYQISVAAPVDEQKQAAYDLFRESIHFVEPALTKVVSVADADEATKVNSLLTYMGARVRLGKMRDELPMFYASMINSVGWEVYSEFFASTAMMACNQAIGLPVPVTAAASEVLLNELHGAHNQLGPKHGLLRIMLRARERQSATKKLAVIEQVKHIVADELASDEWQESFVAMVNGQEYLQNLKESVSEEEWSNLLESLRSDPSESKSESAPENWDQIVADVRDHVGKAEVTGFFVLLTNLIKSMIRDQWVCFGVATATIAVMMLIAFRSLLLALIALVPNALPIVMVFGLMGWLGEYYDHIKINMGAAMIAAVSMGLSVDSSIHYIISFQRERRVGKSVHDSLAEVQQTVGRAVVFSTLALIVGFSILCVSNFVPTIYFGVLVSLSMLGGLFGNLVVLPLLLRLTIWERS